VPAIDDPAWEAEVRGLMGGMLPGSFRYIASSPSIRHTYLDAVRTPVASLAPSEMELAGLVTSQENACRYCYGSARVRMKMLGFTDEMVDRIERNVQLVEAEPRERELVQFCRNHRSASCVAGAPSLVAALSAADTREALADPGPAGAELRFILLASFTEALGNTTRHLRDLLGEPQGAKAPELDRLLALLHGAKR